MRPKRPTHLLIDQVRITRDGDTETIDHADPNLSGTHLTIGPQSAAMTDADIQRPVGPAQRRASMHHPRRRPEPRSDDPYRRSQNSVACSPSMPDGA